MGLVDSKGDVTIEKILLDRKGEVTLIEGDPGSGKTTLTLQICKQWAEGKLMENDLLIMIPLRSYELATSFNDLFGVFENLGCPVPGMKEYALKNNGKGLVLILDGWDELPSPLQSSSPFSDVVFGKNNMFFYSTIIVTSRPSCSENIAKVVQQRQAHYQILGFSPHNSELFIKHYFSNDSQSADLLLAMLKHQEYLRRHFYIPITMAIMCYVYSHSDDGQIPETLSKLYEDFILLYVCSNVPETCHKDIKGIKTLSDISRILEPIFDELCKAAYDMLRDNKLVFDEDVLSITDSDLKSLNLNSEQFDGFGLLHVEYLPVKWATTKRSYSFIHRAVQELLAANFILGTVNISDVLDEHFHESSFVMNIFPFLFGLVSKELLRPLASKLIEVFNKSGRSQKVFDAILYCLFEAHDEILCHEFGQAFSENKSIELTIDSILDCHYACYFIAVCGGQGLILSFFSYSTRGSCDLYIEILHRYLQNMPNCLSMFELTFYQGYLSYKSIYQLAEVLSTQQNIVIIKLCIECEPAGVAILCNSICKHNPLIHFLLLPTAMLCEVDLVSIGYLLIACPFLEGLRINGSPMDYNDGISLDLSHLFCEALCKVKSLQKLLLPDWGLSQADSEVFGKLISQNHSLKELHINVDCADCLEPILNGLSSNTSITIFKGRPSKISNSNILAQYLKKCLVSNHSLNLLDFTEVSYSGEYKHVSWSSTQVASICTGLCANSTVVTLNISGCYVDTEACHAVCKMLSQNKTLQYLFLNPIHLEKQEAFAMIDSCRDNASLKLLSLVKWPPSILRYIEEQKNLFQFSGDPEIDHVLLKIKKFRQEKDEPLLNVYWLVCSYKYALILLSIIIQGI